MDPYRPLPRPDPRTGIGTIAIFLSLLLGPMSRAVSAQVFYPPSPDAPRLQLLLHLRSEADLKKKPNWFLRFLFGRELEEQWLRKSLARPFAAAYSDRGLLVTDSRPNGFWILDGNRKTFDEASLATGSPRPRQATGIAVAGDGRILISDTARKEVLVYSPDLRYQTSLGSGILDRPAGLAVDRDTLFVADPAVNRIVAFSLSTGRHRVVVGADRPEESPIGAPGHVAVAPDGSLYVSEVLAGRVTHFSRSGERLSTVTDLGDGLANTAAPKGIAVDREGHVYIADARFNRLQVFDRWDRLLLLFGRTPEGTKDVGVPSGLTISYDDLETWQRYAAPGFRIEYVITVVNQLPASVQVYGFGRMVGRTYPDDPPPP